MKRNAQIRRLSDSAPSHFSSRPFRPPEAMASKQVPLTKEAQQGPAELDHLQNVRRAEVAQRIHGLKDSLAPRTRPSTKTPAASKRSSRVASSRLRTSSRTR
jgi:hypothetical protein